MEKRTNPGLGALYFSSSHFFSLQYSPIFLYGVCHARVVMMMRGTTPNRRVHWNAEEEPSAPPLVDDPSEADRRASLDDSLDVQRRVNDLKDANYGVNSPLVAERSAHWDAIEDDRASDWTSYIDDPTSIGKRKATSSGTTWRRDRSTAPPVRNLHNLGKLLLL